MVLVANKADLESERVVSHYSMVALLDTPPPIGHISRRRGVG